MRASNGESSHFRVAVRAWLADHAPSWLPDGSSVPEQLAAAKGFQAALWEAGFAGITWPFEYGGQGLSQADQQTFDEEARAYDLPVAPFVIGLGMCGPTIVDLGTEEQKRRFIAPMLRGEEIWCQLFSEPGAGSDIASLQMRAEPYGDSWILTGQKLWTTGAQNSDFGVVLARTDSDVPKHRGLTMFIVDMRAPGVEVRPLRVMSGQSPFNEVHFNGAAVPGSAVLGVVNEGWAAAVAMLGHERVSIGTLAPPTSDPLGYTSLLQAARAHGRDMNPVVRDQLADAYGQERALQLFVARLRQEAESGRDPGARGSIAKLVAANISRQAVALAGLAGSADAVAWSPEDASSEQLAIAVLSDPGIHLAGGTDEIQRNIIGERVLGLPKEPQVDRDVPFRELKVGTQRTI